MHNLIITDQTYYIVHNHKVVVTHGFMESGQISTPIINTIEQFETEEAYLSRCQELEIDTEIEDLGLL